MNGKITFGNGVGIDATQGGNTKKLNLVLWTDQGTNSFGDASVTLSDTTVIKTNNGHLWIGGSPMSGMATDTWNNLTVGSGWASRSENSGPAAGIVLGSANIDTGSGDIKLRGQSQAWTSASSCQTDCEAITSTVGGVLRTTGSLVIDAAFAGGGRVLNMGGEILVGGGTTLNFVNNTEGGYWPYRIQLDNPANTLVNPATVNDGLDPAGFIYTVGPLPVDSSPIYLRLTGGGSSVYGSTPSFGYAFYDAASAGTAVTNASPTGTVTWSGAPTSSDSAGIYSLTYSSGITLGNSAFTLSPGSAVSWTVSPAPLTVTARNVSKVYGQTPTLTAYSVSGLQNSETIGSASLSSSGTVATAGVTGSPYRIIASAATGGTFDARNYSITYVNGNLTVSAAPLTITASNASKVYGQTPTLSSFTSSALQNSETIGSVTETSTGSAVTAGVAGSPYSIVASAATGGTFAPGNYSISYVNGDLAVTPLAIAVATNTGATRVYDGTTNAASSLLNVTNAINGDTVSLGGSTTLVGANAGTETVSGMGGLTTSNPNYTVVGGTASGSVAVSPAALTVTASNASKVYGQAPTLTGFTASGLVAGQTIGSVTETSTGSAVTAGVAGSPYSIVASAATGGTFAPGNYSISYVNGDLAVTPLAIAVATNTGATRVYDGTTNAASSLLNVTNAINGDTVSLGGSTTLVGANAGTETVSGMGGLTTSNPNYTVVGGTASGSVAVSPAALTVTASNASKVYGQAPTLTGFTASGLVAGQTIGSVTETSTGSAVTAGVAGSPYSIVASAATGGTFAPGNYSISYVNGNLTVTPLPVAIATVAGATREYDGTANATVDLLTVTNAVNGDTVTLVGNATLAASTVGSEALASIAGISLNNPNYTVAGGAVNGSVMLSLPQAAIANTATQVPANRSATNYPSLTLPAQVSTSTAAGDRPADSIVNVVNPLPQITAAFGPNTTLTVISSPNASEPSQVVSLSQVRNMLQSSSQGGGTPAQAGIPQDVRVPVSRNSLADIVNGGVRLPDGVEQELFVVQAN